MPGRPWRLALDTAEGFDDCAASLAEPRPLGDRSRRTLIPHSLVVLVG